MFDQKDVVLVPFPYSDLTGAKQRPALIVSNQTLNKTEDRICCLITSNNPRQGVPINAGDFKKGGLPFRSWVKPNRVFTVSQTVIRKKLCTVSDAFHDQIVAQINIYLRRE